MVCARIFSLRWVNAFFLAILISLPVLALTPKVHAEGDELVSAPLGTVVTNPVKIGRVYVPLPPGEWRLIGHNTERSQLGSIWARIVLANIQNGQLRDAAFIQTVLNLNHFYGYAFYRECGRNDIFFVKVFSNYDASDQDCWLVNHSAITVGKNAPKEYLEALDYLRSESVPIPSTMIVHWHRFANRSNFLNANFYRNPDADGIQASATVDWRSSEWNIGRVSNFPEKQKYLQRVREFGERWHALVKIGFEGKPPSLPEATSSMSVQPEVGADVGARLRQLQDLRDKNLITPSEYDERRQAILKTL